MLEVDLRNPEELRKYDLSVLATRRALGLSLEECEQEVRYVPPCVGNDYILAHPHPSEAPFLADSKRCRSVVPFDIWLNPNSRWYPCPCGKVLWKLPRVNARLSSPFDRRFASLRPVRGWPTKINGKIIR